MIRHAAIAPPFRLTGRGDPPAAPFDAPAVPRADRVIASPARRCVQTATALFGAHETDARLWEQDFGAWEGMETPPDIGPLTRGALASHRPPGGESFADLFARTVPALNGIAQMGGTVAVVAHAGTVRAALGLALGRAEDGLAFQIAPLSVTCLVFAGEWSIASVNTRP